MRREKYDRSVDKGGALYSIVLFDQNSRELYRLLPGELLCIDMAFSPDGKKRLPAKSKKKVRAGECILVWDLQTRAKPTKLEVTEATRLIAWANDSTLVGTPHHAAPAARAPKSAFKWSLAAN